MTSNEITEQHNIEEQEIDLVELAKSLWNERWWLVKLAGIAAVIGLVVAFSIPKEFTTTVQIAPEAQGSSGGSLGGIAALANMNINQQAGGDAIRPSLYPNVVQSNPFLLELFPIEVTDKKGEFSGTMYEYMFERQKGPWWGYITRAPFQVLGFVMSLFKEKEEVGGGGLNPFNLTGEQASVVSALKERISVAVDQKTMTVTLTVQMQDPLISAQVADVVLEKLQAYITDYRTRKSKKDLEFTEKIFADAREAYYEAQQNYARFIDGNRNIATASFRTEQERMQNEVSLAFGVYNTLAQKLEQDKLKVQEQTPVYTVIEPATVPIKASSPKKMMILIGFVFLAVCGGCGWILFVRDLFKKPV